MPTLSGRGDKHSDKRWQVGKVQSSNGCLDGLGGVEGGNFILREEESSSNRHRGFWKDGLRRQAVSSLQSLVRDDQCGHCGLALLLYP